MKDKAAWRPRRFDVAGSHPDEAWRAVAELVSAVDEIGKQWSEVEGFPRDLRLEATRWRQKRPLRYGDNLDADVQQFITRGVRIMDRLNKELPVGLSHNQNKVRDRCAELARSMEKTLAQRPDEYRRSYRRGRGRSR
jgi:hypothetical protein